MFTPRAVTVADFETIAAIIESSQRLHDPEGTMPDRHPTELGGPPFSWWGDSALSWWLALRDQQPVGFAMWRHHERNVHLHCFFVAAEVQRGGIGSALMRFHFEQAASENASLDSLTLHVRREALWARAFYAKHGYVERDPRGVPVDEQSGLGDWVRTYLRFGWPESGKLMLHRAPLWYVEHRSRCSSVPTTSGSRRSVVGATAHARMPSADENDHKRRRIHAT
jgi:ribosomal protein S18 acetylase RimI-like enzyme